MNKKNLDKLFQEKFEDFTDVPTEKVWKSIEVSLDNKKKNRKVIPFWWKLGGIAAVLAIGLFLMNPFKDNTETTPAITNIEGSDKDEGENKIVEKDIINVSPEITESSNPESNRGDEIDADTGMKKGTRDFDIQSGKGSNHNLVEKGGNGTPLQNQKPNNTSLAVSKVIDPVKKEGEKQSAIAANTSNGKETTSDKAGNKQNNTDIITGDIEKPMKEGIAQTEKEESNEAIEEKGKKSIFDEITEKEEEVVAEVKESKWSAGPSVAPVYFDAIGEGSPVNSIFEPNSKSGKINYSYGLAVSYEISKKLSVKMGISKVDYGYNTNNIEFSSSLQSLSDGQLDNIDYSNESADIVVESKHNQSNSPTSGKDFSAKEASFDGVMAQQLGYLEVPLQLNYSLIDNKFGIDLIGGFSSLFLVDNAVTLTSGELIAEVGEANNVNNVNFSTNVGFGLNYKFSPKIKLNIEPVFKYQLNTFSETSGDFRPFAIGIYSGLNFKF